MDNELEKLENDILAESFMMDKLDIDKIHRKEKELNLLNKR